MKMNQNQQSNMVIKLEYTDSKDSATVDNQQYDMSTVNNNRSDVEDNFLPNGVQYEQEFVSNVNTNTNNTNTNTATTTTTTSNNNNSSIRENITTTNANTNNINSNNGDDTVNGNYATLNGLINSLNAAAISEPSNTNSSTISGSFSLNFLSQLSQSSKMTLTNLAMREKKCRVYEREANELKDVICSMNHMVHILENIKRVSSDYIHCLYELISASVRHDNDQMEHIQQDIADLDNEMKQWERKYHVMSSFNASNGGNLGNFGAGANVSNITNIASNATHLNHNNSSIASSEQCAEDQNEADNVDSNELDLLDQQRSIQNNSGHSNGSMMLIPQELCEMSMETHEGDSMSLGASNNQSSQAKAAAVAAAAAAAIIMNPTGHSSAASSPLIAAAVAAAQAATATENATKNLSGLNVKSKTSTSSQYNNSSSTLSVVNNQSTTPTSSKPLFRCDYQGCDYYTNMRQRLAMHKRMHAGEMLYTCDIPGCGYQSNYKGNIKIHKKHRHRIGPGDQTTPNSSSTFSPFGDTAGSAQQRNRTRGRKRKLHTMSSNNTSNMKKFENRAEEGQNSSGEIYSGNESGNKESYLPLYECGIEGCNYRSKWKQCLTAHQFLHAGVKPYKCDYPGCNYRTNFKGNVNVHKRVHRANEFQCKISGCKFSTPWKNSFLIHQRNHTLVVPNGSVADKVTTSSGGQNKVITRSSSNHQTNTSNNQVQIFDTSSANLSPSSISLDSTTNPTNGGGSHAELLQQNSNSPIELRRMTNQSREGIDDDDEDLEAELDDEDEELEVEEEEEIEDSLSVMSFDAISANNGNSIDPNSSSSFNSAALAVAAAAASASSVAANQLEISTDNFTDFDQVMH